MGFRTTWWLPFMLVGILGAIGAGNIGRLVVSGMPTFWPALAGLGGTLWLFLIVSSVQMSRVPASSGGPMAFQRLDVLQARAGRADDRLPVVAPPQLRALVETS